VHRCGAGEYTDLEADTGNVTDGVTSTTEAGNQYLVLQVPMYRPDI